MNNFLRPNKTKLKNAQHYAFIDAFLTAIAQENFTAAKIVALLSLLSTAFTEEDRLYMIARASELIAQRDEADHRRDDFYSRLHSLVRLWSGSGEETKDAAATRVKVVFNLYKVKTSAQLDEETGQLDNLIADLSSADMQTDLATIGGTWLFTQMVAAHNQVKSIRLEEGTEQSEKVIGALTAARKNCDQLYDQLTYLIEAFAMTADNSAAYEAFIKRWNGTLKIYQDMLDRKSGTSSSSSSSSSSNSGSSSSQQGGTTTNESNGTNEGNGGENTNPTNGDEPIPDDDEIPSSGGGENTGGGLPPSGGGETGGGGDEPIPDGD